MVHSMRSGTMVRPGETLGCVGCHENRRVGGARPTPQPGHAARAKQARALVRPAAAAELHWPKSNRFLTGTAFPATTTAGRPGRRSTWPAISGCCSIPLTLSCRSKKYVQVIGAGPFQIQPPKSWGAHVSPLVQVLLEGHGDRQIDREIQLDAEGFDRIITWIDMQCAVLSRLCRRALPRQSLRPFAPRRQPTHTAHGADGSGPKTP